VISHFKCYYLDILLYRIWKIEKFTGRDRQRLFRRLLSRGRTNDFIVTFSFSFKVTNPSHDYYLFKSKRLNVANKKDKTHAKTPNKATWDGKTKISRYLSQSYVEEEWGLPWFCDDFKRKKFSERVHDVIIIIIIIIYWISMRRTFT
jgi:hypothetical protein